MTSSARPSPPASPPAAVGPVDIRPLMTAFPTGVTVVTALGAGDRPWGMTCSSLCSVSLAPPVVLVCLRRGSPTLEAVLHRGSFAVNLLQAGSRPVAELFASSAADRFDRVPWTVEDGAAGPHLVGSSHSIADCRLLAEQVVGDHAVLLAGVEAVRLCQQPDPLLYGLRRYARWPADADRMTASPARQAS